MIATDVAIPLAEARDESEFGGKAVHLGTAIRAGLPVPPGVALSASLVAAVVAREPPALLALSEVRASIDGPLAVRSSCVGEDSAEASFAGQHQTKLGVRTAEQLVDGVDAVGRSARSEAALAYRRRLGLGKGARMGVVVQHLIEADVAGVMFTQNPVTGANERLIEAAWGLGEAVVQGLVIPDTYRVSPSGDVLERIAGRKPRAIRSGPDGSTAFEPVAPHLAGALCLDDTELGLLHRLARVCEATFHGPNDIEWAIAGGASYLLQRRRITSQPG